MTRRSQGKRDPLEAAIEAAFCPGDFIGYGAGRHFVSGLEAIESQVESLLATEPERACSLYETLVAGAYEKAGEIDDSGGELGMFVNGLYCGWLRARQAAGANADETITFLLTRMEDDPFGFAFRIDGDAVKVMNRAHVRAFARLAGARLDAALASAQAAAPSQAWTVRHWGEVLRTILVAQKDSTGYAALCDRTGLSAADCLALATMAEARREPDEALAWVERGIGLAGSGQWTSAASYELAPMRRRLLVQVGRADEAVADAWNAFRARPSRVAHEELMLLVPRAERIAWHARAMDTLDHADLASLIDLLLATKERDRLAERLRATPDAELERVRHYQTEPAARALAKTAPDVAARVYRAMGLRILDAKKSRYYDAALANLADARRCYRSAGLEAEWQALIEAVRGAHRRKSGFIGDFERLVAGEEPGSGPSFLDRARSRWPMGVKS